MYSAASGVPVIQQSYPPFSEYHSEVFLISCSSALSPPLMQTTKRHKMFLPVSTCNAGILDRLATVDHHVIADKMCIRDREGAHRAEFVGESLARKSIYMRERLKGRREESRRLKESVLD